MTRALYLHGFASSPQSKKAQFFATRFSAAGASLEIPDLVTEGFFHLTVTAQLRAIEAAAAGRRVSLIGSSLGGYLAALYASRHPGQVARLVLLAPAFGFARRWKNSLSPEALAAWQSTGALSVMNYAEGGMADLGWRFLEDSLTYEDEPAVSEPCLIVHGLRDDVVPVEASRSFARHNNSAALLEIDDTHELCADLPGLCQTALDFLSA